MNEIFYIGKKGLNLQIPGCILHLQYISVQTHRMQELTITCGGWPRIGWWLRELWGRTNSAPIHFSWCIS